MSMPVSVGCQHLDVEACVGLCMCEVGGVDDEMWGGGGGVAVADKVKKKILILHVNFSSTINRH